MEGADWAAKHGVQVPGAGMKHSSGAWWQRGWNWQMRIQENMSLRVSEGITYIIANICTYVYIYS